MNNNDFSFFLGGASLTIIKKAKQRYVLCAKKIPRQSAVITMRTFFVKYYFKVEVVLD